MLNWNKLSLNKKISFFIGTMFFTIVVAVLIDVALFRFYYAGYNRILEDNADGSRVVAAIEQESADFERYIRNPSESSLSTLKIAVAETRTAIYAIDLSYSTLGEARFAQLMAIMDSYENYSRKRNEILSGREESEEYITKLYAVYDMQDYLLTYSQRFVSLTLTEGNERYRELFPRGLIIGGIAILLFIALFAALLRLAALMRKTITYPVLALAGASRKIADNEFDTPDVVCDSQDEMGELVSAFNKMKYATGEYIAALEEKREAQALLHEREVEKLEFEKQIETMNLQVLKNQINPHFLFNTLNVIGGMANLENAATTEEMIGALSSLFRYNLKTQETTVPVSRELKVAADYMYLQKMRFGSRLEYEVSCTVDRELCLMPAFVLQPLLENAVIHGITPKVDGGCARVSINSAENRLIIMVSDDGLGMDAKTLASLTSRKNSRGIGVSNIFGRIHALYPDGEMKIDSTPGLGTRITINIPI